MTENEEDRHLKSLDCPKCGEPMTMLKNYRYLVGCMEYEIWLCERDSMDFKVQDKNFQKSECRILIINYPHKSSEKKMRTIKL